MMTQNILQVDNLQVHFKNHQHSLFAKPTTIRAVDGVDLAITNGETLSIVGESGCGKSTLARAILGLLTPTGGSVIFNNKELTTLSKKQMRRERQHLQMIFQDPLASLNPRLSIGQIVAEPLHNFSPHLTKQAILQQVREILISVGLSADQLNRYPHELSGGQCQRVGIARALICHPQLIICDEPVSALDVSIQAQIINLLMDIQKKNHISLLFIAHDLSIVKHISHRVMVMYKGKVVELAPRDQLYDRPRHPYTQLLLASVPIPEPVAGRQRLNLINAEKIPQETPTASGCAFYSRCPIAQPLCAHQTPLLKDMAVETKVACHAVR